MQWWPAPRRSRSSRFAGRLEGLAQRFQDRFAVSGHFHVAPRLGDLAGGGYEEGAADGPLDFLAVHDLLAPSAVGLVDLEVGVAEQRESYADLVAKAAVALHRVLGDPDDARAELSKL